MAERLHWRRLGIVGRPAPNLTWSRTHATCPTPVVVGDVVRVYYSARDDFNVGRVGFVELDRTDLTREVTRSTDPVLDVGAPGMFDDSGVLATCVLRREDGAWFMYYVGFELCTNVRYRLLAGLAVSRDHGVHFSRIQATPVLERSAEEPLFRCGPFVLPEGRRYRMWYAGGGHWTKVNGKDMPVYDLRYVESEDGVHWPDRGQVCLPLTDPDEHGFGRPWVLRVNHAWLMTYSVRRRSLGQYRIGAAVSWDGRNWARKDDVFALDVGEASWESTAVMYAAPVFIDGKLVVFYNGNDFGREGFAAALCDDLTPLLGCEGR